MVNETIFRRYEGNPIITAKNVPGANSIFNSAVMRYGKGYIGVFRVDNQEGMCWLHLGRSADGLKWDIEPERIVIPWDDPEMDDTGFGYDPRL